MRLPTLSTLLISALVATAPAAADWNAREVLGNEGERYTIRSVPLEGSDTTAGGSALQLEVERSGGKIVRQLVPGTEGKDPDLNPYLIFDDASSALYVVWETRVSGIFSQVRLTWLQDGVWSDPVHVQSNPFAARSEAHLAVTRDRFTGEEDGELVEHQRTLIHIAWWEDSEGGRVVYAPLTLVDGLLTGESRSFSLQQLAEEDLAPGLQPGECSGGAARADGRRELALEAVQGGPRGAVLLTFVDQVSACLHTVQIAPVPADLVSLGEKLRAHMIEIGNRSHAGDVGNLADELRAHMIEIGQRLEPPVRGALARAVHDRVLDVGSEHGLDPEGMEALGDDLRAHMIEIGRQLESVSTVRHKSTALASTLEIGGSPADGATADGSDARHLLQLRLLATRTLPEGIGENPRYLLSPDARRAVVAWNGDGTVRYRESQQDGWSQVRSLAWETAEDRAQVYELLYDRVQR